MRASTAKRPGGSGMEDNPTQRHSECVGAATVLNGAGSLAPGSGGPARQSGRRQQCGLPVMGGG
jgi:hypothetical protein